MRLQPSNDGSRVRSAGAAGRAMVARLLTLGAALMLATTVQARQDAPLPTDPALLQGELANGVRYMVRPTGAGDPVTMRLLVPAGAIHQSEDLPGLADVVHHLVESRLEPPPEGVAPSGYITLDAAHFIVRVDAPTPDRLDAALAHLAQVLESRVFGDAETEREARAAASRMAAFEDPDQRVQQALLSRLGMGRIAASLPTPGMAPEALTAEAAESFHAAHYAPGSSTIVVVGGVAPDALVARIGAAFDALPAREAPALDWQAEAYTEPMAAVVADAELAECDVDIVAIAESPRPPATFGEMRRELTRTVALRALERRLAASVTEGAPFDDATAHVIDIVGLARMYNVFVIGEPDAWEAMLGALVAHVRTVRETGFDPLEVDRAAEEVLADLRRAAQADREDLVGRLAARLAFSASSGRPPMSMEQRLDLTTALLRNLMAAEVADELAAMFDPQRIAYAVSIPAEVGAEARAGLDAAQVLAAARSDEKAFETGRAALLARIEAPTPDVPGEVSLIRMHSSAGVLSARLSNNALVHHREMDDPAGVVHVTVSLAGGRIEECSGTRGLTDAAALGLSRPATDSLSGTQVRNLLARSNATLDARLIDDALVLRMSAAPEDLDLAMRTLYGLLADARIEPTVFDAWRRARVREAKERASQPFDALRSVLPRVIFAADEARVRPLEPDEVEDIDLEPTQAWLDRLLEQAPIEVGVAGPIDGERAIALAAATIGALPARQSIRADTFDHLRNAQRAAAPFTASITLESQSEQALTLLARFAPAAAEIEESERLAIAAAALDARLDELGRGRPGLVYPMSARSAAARVYPDFGLVYAIAGMTGDRQDEFTALLEREWALFLDGAFDDESIAAAQVTLAAEADEELTSASEWSGALALLTYRGRDLQVILDTPDRLMAYTPDSVRDAARRRAAGPAIRIEISAACPADAIEKAANR